MFCKWQKKTRYQGKETMMKQMGLRVYAATVAAACGVGWRTVTTASKALGGIDRLKGGKTRTSSSELCKYLGIPDQTRSDKALIISKFIKLYNFRSPGIKKDKIWEQNLQTLLRGKNSVGFPEIAKILSPEFSSGIMHIKDNNMDSFQYSGGDNTKGKTPQKKLKSKK